MGFTQIVGLIVFFIAIFIAFTIIPRIILTFIKRLLEFNRHTEFKSFFSKCKDMLLLYTALGTPFAMIFYQGLSFGNAEIVKKISGDNFALVCFATIVLSLIAIRLSILLKKRFILDKLGLGKILDTLTSKEIKRKTLKSEYSSYLFALFFSAFLTGILIISFKVVFLPEQTFISIKGITLTLIQLINNLGKYFLYLLGFIIIIAISEGILQLIGAYEIEIEISNKLSRISKKS